MIKTQNIVTCVVGGSAQDLQAREAALAEKERYVKRVHSERSDRGADVADRPRHSVGAGGHGAP